MATKQPPCCARLSGKVITLESELATVARRTAYAQSKNRDIERYKPKIAEAKRVLAMARERVIEHEAEHAAD